MGVLANNKSIKVNMLAELISVSQVTLRKDLDDLEKHGIIRRMHGCISLDGANNIGKRLAFNYSIKRRIALEAVQIIGEGETVMVESGSCCALLAEELALARKNVTIITNSLFIANFISDQPCIKIILLGGCFRPESQMVTGSMTTICAQKFYIDKFFIGVDGFAAEQGFTGRDILRVETIAGLAGRTNKVFVLTESAKFLRRGTYNLIKMDKLTGVFTDDKIPKAAETVLINKNIIVHKVPVVEEKLRWRRMPGYPPILYKERE